MFMFRLLVYLILSALVTTSKAEEIYPNLDQKIKGYMTYRENQTYENVVTTTPFNKKTLDLNVLELEAEYETSIHSKFEFEIEIEHGGTGSSLEYEPLEEFGEFESEIEKGGEVILSKIFYRHEYENQNFVQVGKMAVPISLSNWKSSFLDYSSVEASAAEAALIPNEWNEVGIQYQKKFSEADINIRLLLSSGLNSEFFRKYNWVAGGYQKKFERINAENLAATLAVEYGSIFSGKGLAMAFYYGDTSKNRFKKNKLQDEAVLLITSVFGAWNWKDFEVRSQFIKGSLSNSDKVSLANATLTTSVNPGIFSSIGAEAQIEMIELAYVIHKNDVSFLKSFVSYEHVDSMQTVKGSILKDDRYNKVFSSLGLMKKWDNVFFTKFQYTKHSNALTGLLPTNEYQLAFGFDWTGYDF